MRTRLLNEPSQNVALQEKNHQLERQQKMAGFVVGKRSCGSKRQEQTTLVINVSLMMTS